MTTIFLHKDDNYKKIIRSDIKGTYLKINNRKPTTTDEEWFKQMLTKVGHEIFSLIIKLKNCMFFLNTIIYLKKMSKV